MNRYLPIASTIGIITTITLNSCSTSTIGSLERSEIYAKAKEFTVQIDGEETGTGTIIERDNNTYTVITCWHVMDTPGNYQVTTPDGSTHQVTKVENLPDIDLAIVTFDSSNAYSIAKLGDSTQATSGLDAYVVGYPDPFPGVPERQYFTDSTEVQSRLTQGENGYQIIHDGSFTPGSSGGGIFDNQARLIGINGQFISEGNTGKAYGTGIPLELYLAATGNFATPANVLPPQDFVSIGKRKLKQEDYKAAITEFDRALASNPDDLEALAGRGEAYYLLKDFDAAISDFDAVLARDANNAIFLFYRGTSHSELGEQYDKAIADYTRAISLNPEFANAYSNRGASYGELEEHDRAIANYTRAISLNPEYADAYNNRGTTYNKLEEHDRAIADLTRAISLNPEYVDAYNNRGVSYKKLEQYDRAIADFTQAISLNPEFATAYYNRGNSYGELGEYDRAIANYTRAISLNPEIAGAYNNRGNSYKKLEEYDKAIADFTQAISLNPEYADAYYNRGNSYDELGEYDKAIGEYTQAISINPQLASAYALRGVAHAKMGNKKEAIENFQRAADLYQQQGNIELAEQALDRIRGLQDSY